MSQLSSSLNNIRNEEDFWKDVLIKQPNANNARIKTKIKKSLLHKTNTHSELNQINTSRQAKFNSLINKYKERQSYFDQDDYNNTMNNFAHTHRSMLKKNIDMMLLKQKKKTEARQRLHEENKQNKTNEEMLQCTFQPSINHNYPNKKDDKDNEKDKKTPKATAFYDRNMKWLKSIQVKSAEKKQLNEYSAIEYTFRPQINDNPVALANVFDKTQSEAVLPQNIFFLNTKENNRKKRHCASSHSLPNSNDMRNKTMISSRARSLHCSIDAIRTELRSTYYDYKNDKGDE